MIKSATTTQEREYFCASLTWMKWTEAFKIKFEQIIVSIYLKFNISDQLK